MSIFEICSFLGLAGLSQEIREWAEVVHSE